MNLDGFSLSFLVKELRTSLVGARVDKIFQLDRYSLLLWLRLTGENVKLLISANPEHPGMHLIKNLPENPAEPPAFCMLLRKHLEDGRIAEIEQYNMDRIIRLNIDMRGDKGLIVTKSLIIELMGKHSNIILVQNDQIIDSIRRVGANISRYRQVLPGREYIYPPAAGIRYNIVTTPVDVFVKAVFAHANMTLAKAIIATGDGFGPITANEISYRANLPATMPITNLPRESEHVLLTVLTELIAKLKNLGPTPTLLQNSNNKVLGVAAFDLTQQPEAKRQAFLSMNQMAEYVDGVKTVIALPEKEYLTKLIANELAKLTKKQLILTKELAEANDAEAMRKTGDILMASIYQLTKGLAEITVPDIYAEHPETDTITVTLDPKLNPLENAQLYYTKYTKLKRAQKLLAEQLNECGTELSYLETVKTSLDYVNNSVDILEIKLELIAQGYLKENNKKKLKLYQASRPWSVLTAEGATIIIGKNNKQNDMVTFKEGRPDDIWLHTKDIPGSHVIIKTKEGSPSQPCLLLAAQLAAYFSKARQSSNVPVDYTKRRYVKKPSGAKPGFVIYERQTTVFVTPEEEYLKTILP